MGLLDNLFGRNAAPQAGGGLMSGIPSGGQPADPNAQYAGNSNVGNIMQALGYSLLSSPRQAPLANFGEYLPALQEQSRKERDATIARRGRNKTADMLEQRGYTLEADALRNGQMDGNDAIKMIYEQENKNPYMAAGDGRFFNTKTGDYEGSATPLKPTANQQDYNFYANNELKANRVPLGPLEYEQALRKSSASTTNISTGEGNKFYNKLDEKNAETFSNISANGQTARGSLGRINRLDALMANAPQGSEAAVKQFLGEFGIQTDGLDAIQSANALIENMIPQQRPAGSGTMSDRDVEMFKRSLPRLINTPGGNKTIMDTMRGIAEYDIQMGEIADAVANRQISPEEGRQRMRDLPNPLENYTANGSASQPRVGATAVNPQTGQRIQFDGQSWKPAQ